MPLPYEDTTTTFTGDSPAFIVRASDSEQAHPDAAGNFHHVEFEPNSVSGGHVWMSEADLVAHIANAQAALEALRAPSP